MYLPAPDEHRERRDSPIFVPAVKPPVKLILRGHRARRRAYFALAVTFTIVIAAFAYAFAQDSREEALARHNALQAIVR